MVASVNGMMVDHSASSQVPEPVPMPEAQRDLIAEAMKVQMKQGQVFQFASTDELYFGPICDDACYGYSSTRFAYV